MLLIVLLGIVVAICVAWWWYERQTSAVVPQALAEELTPSRVPASALPEVRPEMFTPIGVPFDDAQASEAVEKFLRHIGWVSDPECASDEVDAFRSAVREHESNLQTIVDYWDWFDGENAQWEEEPLAILDDEDESVEEKAAARKRLKVLTRARERGGVKRVAAALELRNFKSDRRGFVVSWLNHRIHRRTDPVDRKTVDSLDWGYRVPR